MAQINQSENQNSYSVRNLNNKKRITHGRVEIWSFSSSVQLDISRVSTVNKWDIELDNSCLGIEKDSLNSEKFAFFPGTRSIHLQNL